MYTNTVMEVNINRRPESGRKQRSGFSARGKDTSGLSFQEQFNLLIQPNKDRVCHSVESQAAGVGAGINWFPRQPVISEKARPKNLVAAIVES